jgi:hypothetical protein
VGCIYRLKNSDGTLRSPYWWLKYIGLDGRPQYESSKRTDHKDAKSLSAEREGKLAQGVRVTSAIGRLTFKDAADDLINDYAANHRATLEELKLRLTLHLTPYFGRMRMAEIDTALIRRYITKRQADLRPVPHHRRGRSAAGGHAPQRAGRSRGSESGS